MIKIEEKPSFIFMRCLTHEEEQTCECYKNVDFLISEIEKQMEVHIKQYRKNQLTLKR